MCDYCEEVTAEADAISRRSEEYRLKYLESQKQLKVLQRKLTERGKKKKQDVLTKTQLKTQDERIARLTKELKTEREMRQMVMEQIENYNAALGCMNHTELQYRFTFERLRNDEIAGPRMKEMSITLPQSSSGAYFFGE